MSPSVNTRPRVVIIGGGFGGLYCARALAKLPVQVTLLDRRNHHLFQPLLYQVATAALNASDIAQPIRSILRKQSNVEVLLAEVTAIDAPGKCASPMVSRSRSTTWSWRRARRTPTSATTSGKRARRA
jgi:NADH dehydrogenase FAD-containing subunit